MCYCEEHDLDRIFDALYGGLIPDDALVKRCCWKKICKARSTDIYKIGDLPWQELCKRRGYLLNRQNPRGF